MFQNKQTVAMDGLQRDVPLFLQVGSPSTTLCFTSFQYLSLLYHLIDEMYAIGALQCM